MASTMVDFDDQIEKEAGEKSEVHRSPKYLCHCCGKIFFSEEGLIRRLTCIKKHEYYGKTHRTTYECSDCGKIFVEKQSLDNHSSIHTGVKLYECGKCSKKYANQYSLNKHTCTDMTKHTEPDDYKCETCDAVFTRKSYVKYHIAAVHHQMEFVCHQCGKKYKWRANLNRHFNKRHKTNR